MTDNRSIATFGMGCFWCAEAMLNNLEGVIRVQSGFAGGESIKPTYHDVSSGSTGHAEVCQITYNPAVLSYLGLLEVFWKMHDPTTLNKQGDDVGTQYRSVIFYHNDEQKRLAEDTKRSLDASGIWSVPIVTEIKELQMFYLAGEAHQKYYLLNPKNSYCSIVIHPKLEEFKKVFANKLKADN